MEKVKIDASGIETDMRKYIETYAKSYAKEATKQLTNQAQSCIEMFYRDYTPKIYDRTEDLLRNSYVPYYHNNGRTYYGGVRITADFMSPYYSGGIMNHTYTEPIIIAQLGWHGWHGDPTGYNGRFTPIHTTSPLDTLLSFSKKDNFIKQVESYAEKSALSQKYKYLQFKRGR